MINHLVYSLEFFPAVEYYVSHEFGPEGGGIDLFQSIFRYYRGAQNKITAGDKLGIICD